jgi:hypothetical protein
LPSDRTSPVIASVTQTIASNQCAQRSFGVKRWMSRPCGPWTVILPRKK